MMHIADLISPVGRLRRSTSELKQQWQEAQEFWNDSTSAEFQRDHLDPLLPEITQTLSAIHRMAEVVQRATRECQDPDREDAY